MMLSSYDGQTRCGIFALALMMASGPAVAGSPPPLPEVGEEWFYSCDGDARAIHMKVLSVEDGIIEAASDRDGYRWTSRLRGDRTLVGGIIAYSYPDTGLLLEFDHVEGSLDGVYDYVPGSEFRVVYSVRGNNGSILDFEEHVRILTHGPRHVPGEGKVQVVEMLQQLTIDGSVASHIRSTYAPETNTMLAFEGQEYGLIYECQLARHTKPAA